MKLRSRSLIQALVVISRGKWKTVGKKHKCIWALKKRAVRVFSELMLCRSAPPIVRLHLDIWLWLVSATILNGQFEYVKAPKRSACWHPGTVPLNKSRQTTISNETTKLTSANYPIWASYDHTATALRFIKSVTSNQVKRRLSLKKHRCNSSHDFDIINEHQPELGTRP